MNCGSGGRCADFDKAINRLAVSDELVKDLPQAERLIFYRGALYCVARAADGLIDYMAATWIMRSVRSQTQSIDRLIASGLWVHDTEAEGYRIVGWPSGCTCRPAAALAPEDVSAARSWEAERKRRQRASKRAGGVPPNVPDNVPENVPGHVPELFSPPPKGAGGENNKRATGAAAPASRAREAELQPPSSIPGGALQRREPMDSERDWRAPRRAAAKPPDLGPLRAKLAESSRKFGDRPNRLKPVIPPENSGGGEDK